MKIERRFLQELRADSQGDEMSLVGYASKFGVQSHDLGGFRETVMPGAFARSIREGADVKFLMNHDPSMIMGRTKNKTLELSEDGTGLRFRCVLPNTQAARDLHALVQRGDIDQCSFAFTVNSQSWTDERDENGDMYANRQLMDVDLMDVSAVTYPAYGDTEVNARMFDEEALVEVRSAIDKVCQRREDKSGNDNHGRGQGGGKEDKGTKMGKALDKAPSASTKSEHSAAAKAHKDMAQQHEKLADQHVASANALKEKSDEVAGTNPAKAGMLAAAADEHDAAAAAHTQAGNAHWSAYSAHNQASGSSKATGIDTKGASEKANAASIEASKYRAANLYAIETRGSESQPPKLSPIDLPQPACEEAKEEWWNAFYDAYDSLMKKGGRGYAIKEAIGKAIAAANKLVQPATETPDEVTGGKGKNPTAIKGDYVDTDGDNDADEWGRFLPGKSELRYSEGTLEDRIQDIQCALMDKYGCCASTSMWQGCPKYMLVETYEDHVLVQDCDDPGCYYDIKYSYDMNAEEGEEVTLEDGMTEMEQSYVPSERALRVAELRARKTGKRDEGDSGDEGDPEDVSNPDSPNYDPNHPAYDEALDSSSDNYDQERGRTAFTGEDRDGAKTKKVAGEDLGSGDFAFVGDPADPSTWKLPVHDESHARNALARFNQTKGIPADEKEGVWKKIVSACKKFGIDVSEQDSLRAAMPHSLVAAILSDGWDDNIMYALRARMRTIEIELD